MMFYLDDFIRLQNSIPIDPVADRESSIRREGFCRGERWASKKASFKQLRLLQVLRNRDRRIGYVKDFAELLNASVESIFEFDVHGEHGRNSIEFVDGFQDGALAVLENFERIRKLLCSSEQ